MSQEAGNAPTSAPEASPAPAVNSTPPTAAATAAPTPAAAPAVPDVAPVTAAPASAPVAQPNHTTPAKHTSQSQIVNEKQEFTKDSSKASDKWGMLDKGFSYDIVAVFGSQSTGKSTLSNRSFGTSFDVMDESKRQQTTKGIWMCPSAYSSTLVMDVEGTDGRERGEDQDFERKSALFSLASTEVLIVNLWEHQIGLYQGANMGLSKTVFEVNLGLFGGDADKGRSKDKTLISFVIRDHVGATPSSNLTATSTADMEKIWAGSSKPPHLADTKSTDYFDSDFAALPHKILLPEKFEESVIELRNRFTDRTRKDYVFQPAYHKRIPADGVPFYMDGIWQQVLENKDSDSPTQQESLAQFRCDEIATGVIESFNSSAKASRKPLEAGSVVLGLGASMGDWLKVAATNFDAAASRYHSGVYQRKRLDSLNTSHAVLSPMYSNQSKNARKQATTQFAEGIATSLKAPSYDFAEVVSRCTREARETFVETAKEATLEGSEWDYTTELDSSDEDSQTIADRSRADETKKMVNGIERTVKRQLAEPVELALSKPNKEMWDTVSSSYKTATASGEKAYRAKAASYNCTEDENRAALSTLHSRAWLASRKKLEEQTADTVVLSTSRGSFEDRFRYDDAGVPRVWKPEDDSDGAFKKAREETLASLPSYATVSPVEEKSPELPEPDASDVDMDPEAFDPATAWTLVSPTRLRGLEARFKRDADAAYVEAKRSMVSSISQVPLWMYGALVVLGWNEAMAVLFNPSYFAMSLVAAASAYIVSQLGSAGPLFQIARTVTGEVKRIATDKMREAFAEPQQQRVAVPVAVNATEKRREVRRGPSVHESDETRLDTKFMEK